MSVISVEEVQKMHQRLSSLLTSLGFECHPFKLGWYNEQVSKHFLLPHHPDTVAFVIISTPSMFEKTFIPYVRTMDCGRTSLDPLDQCMVQSLSHMKKEFPDTDIEIIHDFELTPNKRPRILVQTAGHVSGAVRYYQHKDVGEGHWPPEKKVYGVCIHPEYGGWFALRGVAIFTTLTCPHLPRKLPSEMVEGEAAIAELLKRYNDHWEDWSFRNIIPVKERYSQEQCDYFTAKPADRHTLIDKYRY